MNDQPPLWCCVECREATTQAYDFEAGTMAQYERHLPLCSKCPVQLLDNPDCRRVVLKTHPAWNWTATIRL